LNESNGGNNENRIGRICFICYRAIQVSRRRFSRDCLRRPVQCGEVVPDQYPGSKKGSRPDKQHPRVPPAIKKTWGPMVETYLRERIDLRLVVFILDIRREPRAEDIDLMNWFRSYNISYIFALTKIDKLSRSQVKVRETAIKKLLGTDPPLAEIVLFSAKTGEGKDRIWKVIKDILT
jgi:hypothetical protein